ncbi:MAG: hypothetical protein HOP23_07505 [Methylococcaceae bacterium]|nr:hypothetical protein [Methylococcaceae bacterium]
MQFSREDQGLKAPLKLPWIVFGIMLLLLLVAIIFCQVWGEQYQINWPEGRRIRIRTLFYLGSIVALPVTNLIRHIQLRLNETMPGNKSADKRYLLTISVSMIIIEIVGVLGIIMFLLGDGYNTLYIFIGLSTLGLYLYRPKLSEYTRIKRVLAATNKNPDG